MMIVFVGKRKYLYLFDVIFVPIVQNCFCTYLVALYCFDIEQDSLKRCRKPVLVV